MDSTGPRGRVGVVLSSGGVRGIFAHTGFLLALEQLSIGIGGIVGSSAGAIVGGVAASGTPSARWIDAISGAGAKNFWTPDPWPRFLWQMAVHKGRGYTGLSGTEAAVKFISKQLATPRFESCQFPFYALAEDLVTGRKVLFGSGELAPRMMASAALPVLYRPILIEGDLYCDGGVLDLAPTGAICCQHRLDALIVHHVALRREGPAGLDRAMHVPLTMVEILYLLLYRKRPWYLGNEALGFQRCQAGCGAPIIVVEPELPDLQWPATDGGTAVVESACEQTKRLLAPYVEQIIHEPQRLLRR